MDSVSYITLETLQHNEPTYAFFGALFSIGASLLGGLLSKPKAPTPAPAPQVVKVVETKQTPNIQEGVDAAKAAGFNPASAARMGLIQGFMTNETPFLTTNPEYVNWEANNNYQQQKSAWIGNMFSSVGSAAQQWGNYRQNQQSLSQQSRLIDSEIFRNYSQSKSYLQPNQWVAPTAEWHHAKNSGPVATDQYTGEPYLYDWKVGDVTVTNPYTSLYVNPNISDVEIKETRYGDSSLFSPTWFHAWGTQIGDWGHNIGLYNERAKLNQQSNVEKTNQKLNSWLGKPSDWFID